MKLFIVVQKKYENRNKYKERRNIYITAFTQRCSTSYPYLFYVFFSEKKKKIKPDSPENEHYTCICIRFSREKKTRSTEAVSFRFSTQENTKCLTVKDCRPVNCF